MATFTTGLALYDRQRTLFDAIPRTAAEAFREIPKGAAEDLRAMTSGQISSRELARMGHPYAQAGGIPRGPSKSYIRTRGIKKPRMVAPLLPINRQIGALQDSISEWEQSSGSITSVGVGFDAAKAGKSIFAVVPEGTRTVIARGIWTALAKNDRIRLRAYRDVYVRNVASSVASP